MLLKPGVYLLSLHNVLLRELVVISCWSHVNFLQAGKISSLDFHRTEDLLITSCEDDSIRLYNVTNAT